jgi:translation initiation factor IF-2
LQSANSKPKGAILVRQVVETAAPRGLGLRELEEAVLLQAELMELRAATSGAAEATVVEARMDKGQGPVATIIVKRGTLQARHSLRLPCACVSGPVRHTLHALGNVDDPMCGCRPSE